MMEKPTNSELTKAMQRIWRLAWAARNTDIVSRKDLKLTKIVEICSAVLVKEGK